MEYIKMANAHVNQHTTGAKKTDWIIRENKTEEKLGVLPKKLTDNEVFSILEIIRKYEEDGFNAGIVFGKQKYKNVYDPQLKQLEENIKLARNENERLADILDNITKKEK